MARKVKLSDDDIEDIEMDFNPNASMEKLPFDISGGKKALLEYMEIPIDLIDPYGDKKDTDFSSYDEALEDAMLDSIKQYGVMEAITVRAKPDGRYELLAGERRWTYSKKAGLQTIPAHIIKVDDKFARAVFSLTNILRRPIIYRDLIAGWWHFYLTLKESGNLGAMRSGGLSELSPELKAQVGGEAKALSYRQMMRYVKMHNLTEDWINALDAKQTTLRVADAIAGLTQAQQTDVFPYIDLINEEKARQLLELANGTLSDSDSKPLIWDTYQIENIVKGKGKAAPKEKKAKPLFAKPKVMRAVETYLKPTDYERADEIIKKALELYYSQTENI